MSQIQLHDNLIALFKLLQPMGTIAQVVARTIKDTLDKNELTLICFYQLELSEVTADSPVQAFGSCDIMFITTGRFIKLGFYPTHHVFRIENVDCIESLHVENVFATGYEGEGEVATAEERGYSPLEIKIKLSLSSQQGQRIIEWEEDVTRLEDIKSLYRESQLMSQLVGKPLAQASIGG